MSLDRITSAFPISIGTAHALESLFEPTKDVIDPDRQVNKIKLSDHDVCMINLTTLIRNLINAIKNKNHILMNQELFYNILMFEIDLIIEMFSRINIDPILYSSDFNINRYKSFLRKKSKYDLLLINIENRIIGGIRDNYKVMEFNNVISGNGLRGILLTHDILDLVNTRSFKTVNLLESHTGVLKNESRWGSKYIKIKGLNLETLPLNISLLEIYGDRNLFIPKPMKARKALFGLLENKNITPYDSESRVRSIIKSSNLF